jgi:hypothetical protein
MLMVPESVLFMDPGTASGSGRASPPASPPGTAFGGLPVRLQWLVGYRQGLLALYQWSKPTSLPPASAGEAGAQLPTAQLLWHLQLGGLPLSLSPRGWDCQAGGGSGALAVGSQVYSVSVSPLNQRLTARAVDLRGVAALSNLVLPSAGANRAWGRRRGGKGRWADVSMRQKGIC